MSLIYPGSEGAIVDHANPPGSKPVSRPDPIICVDRLEFLLWEVADLHAQQAFLTDFGMQTLQMDKQCLYMRGFGSERYLYVGRKAKKTRFVGMGFCVNHASELETLARATNVAVKPLDRPGGGNAVTLEGPGGLVIEVCHGIAPVAPIPTRLEPLPVNAPDQKVRVNSGQRPALEPSAVLSLGHCVTGVNRLDEAAQWYMRHLGLIATDVVCVPDGSPAIYFMRLDRGEKPADHHCVVVGRGGGDGYLHSAYEVVDLDAIAQGQQYLKSKLREHVWGIGRHILGSQLFDYWRDPQGFEFEHYADGDVYTADYATAYHPLDPGNVYAWGPDMPSDMIKPGLKQVLSIVRGLLRGEVSLQWLKSAMKSVKRPARPWM